MMNIKIWKYDERNFKNMMNKKYDEYDEKYDEW